MNADKRRWTRSLLIAFICVHLRLGIRAVPASLPLELVAFLEPPQFLRVRRVDADQHPEARDLLQPREIPFLVKLVRGLMVVLRVELLEELLSKIRRLAQKLRTLADREGGNPGAREREVVRAVVVPLLGVRLGLDLQPIRRAASSTSGQSVVRSAPDTSTSRVRPCGWNASKFSASAVLSAATTGCAA